VSRNAGGQTRETGAVSEAGKEIFCLRISQAFADTSLARIPI
jgi:environmental stress-induced protein Ves